MPAFVVVRGEAWGVKSYALASIKDEQVPATNSKAAVREAVKRLTARVPKGHRINRIVIDIVRVEA